MCRIYRKVVLICIAHSHFSLGWQANKTSGCQNATSLICRRETETTDHILLLCPRTQKVWSAPNLQLQASMQGITRLDAWVMNFIEKPNALPAFETVASVLWCIWVSRNNAIFRGQVPEQKQIKRSNQLWFYKEIMRNGALMRRKKGKKR